MDRTVADATSIGLCCPRSGYVIRFSLANKTPKLRLDQYLSIYPLSEEMNLLLLQVYIRSGVTEKVMEHYAKFESDYRREWAADPPLEIKRVVIPFVKK